MGWGISFNLDRNVLYCSDGCKWKKTLPLGKSGCDYVLHYFTYTAHSELDMIRDECPGTATALKEACDEHVMYAIDAYERLPEQEKARLSENCIVQLKIDIDICEQGIKTATAYYKDLKKQFKEYKPQNKQHKTRADELRDLIYPLQLELNMENAALRVDQYAKHLRASKRMLKLEI